MNPTVALALIALLQREVNLLELQLAQLQASSTVIVAPIVQSAPYTLKATPQTSLVLQDVPFNSIATFWQQGNMVGIRASSTVNHVVFSYNGTSTACTGDCTYWNTQLIITPGVHYPYTIELIGNTWKSNSSGLITE